METVFTPWISPGGGALTGLAALLLTPCTASFGMGRGIAGFYPGGALPAIGTGYPLAFLPRAALFGGLFIARAPQFRAPTRKPA
ncbi:hypothetical protein [Tabrizicola sp.]|uniref:hypothetical protein n=1 Tax=Tabrizicola sp. TaxID=2005166 RepID=UPI002FDEF464